MRLIKQQIERRTGTGSVVLLPEEPEDMWHAFNLIRPSDLLTASALRRIVSESATGGSSSTRVATTLTIRILSTDFDAGSAQLHVAGRVARENPHVKLGGHHTLDLELGRNFTLTKEADSGGDDGGAGAGGWDSVALATLREATDATKRAEVWAVVMREGLANICLITEHQTILRQRVETSIPRKRRGGIGDHDKAQSKFFATLLATLTRHMDLAATPPLPLLLASPGFTAASFLTFMKETAVRTADKALQTALTAAVVAHASSGHVYALNEVLKSPAVLAKLSDTKYARQTALMDRFYDLLRKDDGRAWYGPREVERAVDKGAVGKGGGVLLISNALFRSQDVGERRRWVGLVDRVRDGEGGEVRVLSSSHESGKRLEGLGNVAAILTFPLEDLDDEEEDGGKGDDGGGVGLEI